MTKLLLPACIAILILSACQPTGKPSWQKTVSGIQYQVFHTTDSGRMAVMMATAKVNVTPLGDTVAAQLVTPMPVYQMVLPPAPYMTDPLAEVLTQGRVREGDSVITVTKENKRTAFAIRKIYVPGLDGLKIDSIVAADKKKELDHFIAMHAALAAPRIEKYLASKNIKAVKSDDNSFTEIINAGAKPLADSGKTAGLKFSVTNIVTNKVINSNIDTSFHQPPVLHYLVAKGSAPRSVDMAIRQLGKGGHARVYLPGIVASGGKVNAPGTDPTQDVVFEVEVVSVN